jgi:hypothetical protein
MEGELNNTGECYCERVAFTAVGKQIFNLLCHCRLCSRARGRSPVHVIGIPNEGFTITRGEEFVKVVETPKEKMTATYENARPMTFAFCSMCGGFVYQCPKGAPFKAVMPTTFQIENPDPSVSCGVNSKLPAHMLPQAHVNYENRLMDIQDDLPKFKTFPSVPNAVLLNNDGTPKT